MPRTRQTGPESQPVAASADNPGRRPTPGAPIDTSRPPGSERPDSALFRVFLATGTDAVTAYTATREMEITAGQNVANSIVAQLGVQIQAVATRIGEVETNLKSDLATVKTDLAGVKTDMATVKTDLAGVKTDVAGVKTDVAVRQERGPPDLGRPLPGGSDAHRRGHPSLRRLNGKAAPTVGRGLSAQLR